LDAASASAEDEAMEASGRYLITLWRHGETSTELLVARANQIVHLDVDARTVTLVDRPGPEQILTVPALTLPEHGGEDVLIDCEAGDSGTTYGLEIRLVPDGRPEWAIDLETFVTALEASA
jgi:hypothetical protein